MNVKAARAAALVRRTFAAAFVVLASGVAASASAAGVESLLAKDDAWFASDDARRTATDILSWQSKWGGWPKNVDTANTLHSPECHDLDALQDNHPTFDNSATTPEMRFLARMITATKDAGQAATCRAAFDRAFAYVLESQYPCGGWPQYFPPGTDYERYVTFNDDAMTRLMLLLDDAGRRDTFPFLSDAQKRNARDAFDHGIEFILKAQIRIDGKLTAWCAQHDPVTYEPRGARTFELPSISGNESVGIVRVLMRVERPSPAVVDAVDSAVAWLGTAAIHGIRVRTVPDPHSFRGTNRVVAEDPAAPPLWARFYDLKTGRPFFADRDGVPKPSLADIGYERRNGYVWLGDWPTDLIATEYPAWKLRLSRRPPSP